MAIRDSGAIPGSMMRFLVLAVTIALLVRAPSLAAQQGAFGSLYGTVRERVSTRSVRAAVVSLVSAESESSSTLTVRPNAQGQFRLDSLQAGRYLIQVGIPTLDSLEISLPAERIEIAAGKTSRFDVTLPSGDKLRDAVCQGLRMEEGKVVVAGHATNADTDKPLPGADMVASWVHNFIDKSTRELVTQVRGASVKTGPNGEYRMCGVPSGTLLSLQMQHDGRATPVVRVAVSDDEGVVVRDFSLSPRTAPATSALDSVAHVLAVNGRDSTREELALVGSAKITGEVRALTGEPVAEAEVRVRDARSATITDSAGHYSLDALPSGTQLLVVRRLGYPIAEMPVELRPDRSVRRDVLLRRTVVLDSVHVVGTHTNYPEFERNRRTNTFGQFLTREQIDGLHVTEAADLFINVFGFTALGHGSQARIVSNKALRRHGECQEANVVINDAEGQSINHVSPSQIAGIEAYADEAFVPARFEGRAQCGVIVIWLRKDPARPMAPMGLSGNGYP
jgi:hypothetical protein